jgi:uncharacterized protein (TIGR03435 family)
MKGRSFMLAAFVIAAAASLSTAQAPPRLTFEVATIRPSQPGLTGGGIKPLPGGDGYIAQNVPVRLMISLMYQVPMRQIVGGPEWLDSDHYDIEAKADHSYGKDDLHEMFRSLLADRFNLKFHNETKEGPVYALAVDKPGTKMKVNDSAQDFKIPITFGRDNSFIGTRVPMQYLSWWLGQQLHEDKRPVIDKTGLDGNYDFTLAFAPELPPNIPRESLPPEVQNLPSIFDALKEQLGLKLEPQKGPIEYYIIDHVERPSPN